MVRPVKAFDAILNAVVMELQRSKGTKVRLTLEIEADAEDGFSEADIGVVRDNARQLKFKTSSPVLSDSCAVAVFGRRKLTPRLPILKRANLIVS